MIKRLSDKQAMILLYLGRYGFLSYSQMMRLGIEKYKPNLSNIVSSLRDSKRPLVRKIPHRRGTEAKHYLTPKGKDVLMELHGTDYQENSIHFLKKILYTDTQDQKHRTSIVDIQIELDFACLKNGLQTLLYERYFDKVGNQRKDRNLKSRTSIEHSTGKTIIPDLTFILQTPVQQELYLLELENGSDNGKSVEKCIRHGEAILKGSANEKYGIPYGYRTLWVFEKMATMEGTMKKLKENPYFTNLTEYFLFKPLEKIRDDFIGGWQNVAGEERKMYYL